MSEIKKLRMRLNNVNRNVSEYRMTISEARELLEEIDILQKPVKVVEREIPADLQLPRTIIIDGGTFQ